MSLHDEAGNPGFNRASGFLLPALPTTSVRTGDYRCRIQALIAPTTSSSTPAKPWCENG